MGPTPQTIGNQLVEQLNDLTPGDRVAIQRIAKEAESLRSVDYAMYLSIKSAVAALKGKRDEVESYVNQLLLHGGGEVESWRNGSVSLARIHDYHRSADVAFEGFEHFPGDRILAGRVILFAPFLENFVSKVTKVVEVNSRLNIEDQENDILGDFMMSFFEQLPDKGESVYAISEVAMDLLRDFENGYFSAFGTHIDNVYGDDGDCKELLTRIMIESSDPGDEERVFRMNEEFLDRISDDPICFDSADHHFMIAFGIGDPE